MDSIVTTKRGDSGQSTALSGEAFSKSHPIMVCAGTLDELRAHVALVRLGVIAEKPRDAAALGDFLRWLLDALFLLGSTCSDPLCKRPEFHRRDLTHGDLDMLEREQARLEAGLELPRAFIVSATSTLAGQADVACTVARRLEREFVRLTETFPDFDAALELSFLNRLSDYLFILARYIEAPAHEAVDYSVLERGSG